jgi:ligand-binding sensor domain-containing protein
VAVTSFAVGSGALWLGTDNGLYKVDLSANDGVNNPIKLSAVSGAIRALALGDNTLWVGWASGVTRLDLSNNSTNFWGTSTSAGAFAHLISSDNYAISVSRPVLGVSGQRDVAWIATGVGVSRFDPSIPSFTSFSSGDGLPSNSVRAVLVLSNGDKVIGTDSGLALYRGP